ncbi:MAG: response regulator [Planctomycetes bacterium]|nr:response regulator [Planctomycetota bacterium]
MNGSHSTTNTPDGRRAEESATAAHAELQRAVSLLRSTQQELSIVRERHERERKVLDAIVRFSERVALSTNQQAFWEHVVTAAFETFECESCMAVELHGGRLSVLAAHGPRPTAEDELRALATLLADPASWRTSLIEGDALRELRFEGVDVAAVMLAAIRREETGPLRALVTAVTTREQACASKCDALCASGLRMFASHVDVQQEMLRPLHLITEQAAALDVAPDRTPRHSPALAQSPRLESIGRLAGGVAHDFNNMLMVICGNAELMQLDSALAQKHKNSLAQVLAASQRAQELTQQLLTFSRRQVIRPSAVQVNALIEDSLCLYRRLIGEEIRLEFAACAEPTPALADRQQFDQVLGNLFLNARDALHATEGRAKELHVSTHVVREKSPLTDGAPAIRIDVRDTGIGMDDATRQQIFEPFFTTKGVGKGTGLGLAVVLGAIEQNHGTIEVHSALDRGTTFSVFWPLVEACATPPQEAKPVAPLASARREHVLLVEDDEPVRDFMAKGLEDEGFTVTVCSTAECALDKLARGVVRPTILVTDAVMPHMNGGMLAEAVRQRYPGLPVLFVSGYADDVVALHGFVSEGVALLEKPFSPSVLARKVREIVDAHSSRGT